MSRPDLDYAARFTDWAARQLPTKERVRRFFVQLFGTEDPHMNANAGSAKPESDLSRLASLCKASVMVEINPHRDFYQTAETFFSERRDREDGDADDIPTDEMKRMIDSNRIARVQFYPVTPIGFCVVYRADVDDAISVALEYMEARK